MVPTVGVLQETFLGPLAPHHLSEVIVGILLMLVIFLIMWKVVVPAFEKMYEERSSKIEGGMQRAAVAEAKAEAMLAEYNDQMAAAREEAARIRKTLRTRARRFWPRHARPRPRKQTASCWPVGSSWWPSAPS